MKRKREDWEECRAGLDDEKMVFLDESGINTAMARRYGRLPRHERLVDSAPAGHRQSNTLLAAVRLDGVVAPMVLDGPVNGDVFAHYIEQSLVPELEPGDMVIMDNLPSHKSLRVTQAIQGAGCFLVYLPPYSPDYNPIENMWSKVKAWLRKVAARTFETVVEAVGEALRAVTTTDCEGYFRSLELWSNVVDDTRDSSGDIFHTVHKPNPSNHLRQPRAAFEFPPGLRRRLAQLEHHRQTRLAGA